MILYIMSFLYLASFVQPLISMKTLLLSLEVYIRA